MATVEGFMALANLGGMGLFSGLVYFELRTFRKSFEKLVGKTVTVQIASATEGDSDVS